MITALVKFSQNAMPTVFGIDNVAHGKNLATMENVEWVQVITPKGYVSRCDYGAGYPDTIAPIPGTQHTCPEATKGMSEAQLKELAQYLISGEKIKAIKVYRQAFDTSLIVSKNAVEEIQRTLRMPTF